MVIELENFGGRGPPNVSVYGSFSRMVHHGFVSTEKDLLISLLGCGVVRLPVC